jgi:hypothetical protein
MNRFPTEIDFLLLASEINGYKLCNRNRCFRPSLDRLTFSSDANCYKLAFDISCFTGSLCCIAKKKCSSIKHIIIKWYIYWIVLMEWMITEFLPYLYSFIKHQYPQPKPNPPILRFRHPHQHPTLNLHIPNQHPNLKIIQTKKTIYTHHKKTTHISIPLTSPFSTL